MKALPFIALAGVLFLVWRKPAAAADAGEDGGSTFSGLPGGGVLGSLADAADNFTNTLAGKSADEQRGSGQGAAATVNTSPPVNVGGVTNTTNNNQNTATFGNGSRTEVGGPLVIGGTAVETTFAGPLVTLNNSPDGTVSVTPVTGIVTVPRVGGGGSADAGSGSGGINNTVNNNNTVLTIGDGGLLHVGSGRRPARDSELADFWAATSARVAGSPLGNQSGTFENLFGRSFRSADDFATNYQLGSNQYQRFQPYGSGSFFDTLLREWNNFWGNTVAFPGQGVT